MVGHIYIYVLYIYIYTYVWQNIGEYSIDVEAYWKSVGSDSDCYLIFSTQIYLCYHSNSEYNNI